MRSLFWKKQKTLVRLRIDGVYVNTHEINTGNHSATLCLLSTFTFNTMMNIGCGDIVKRKEYGTIYILLYKSSQIYLPRLIFHVSECYFKWRET